MTRLLILMALLGAAPVLAQAAPDDPILARMQDNPDGSGHPNAVTCRKPQAQPGSRLPAPPVCLINAKWAELRRSGQDMSPDGSRIVASEKGRTLNPEACQGGVNVARGNPQGASAGAGMTFSPSCF